MEAVASDVHNRVSAASSLDEESVFIDTLKGPVSSVYVASQIAVYLLTVVFVMLRERRHTGLGGVPRALLEVAATVIAAFPVATYLAGAVDAHSLGLWGYVSLLAGIAAALTALVSVLLRQPLDRLLVISGFTVAVLAIDLFLGGPLEINTIFGYSPIVAGRFAGLGNVAYAVLAAASIITATLLVQRHQGSHAALAAAAGLFVLTVVVDGAPMLGSDVGGVLALVPGLGVTWMLLAGRRPTLKAVVLAGLAAVAVLGVFLVVDLSRPETQQTHLARLFDSVVRNGGSVLLETLRRKAEANLHVFTVTIWTYFFPPAMAAVLLLLARPWGRWKRFATTFPRARAGLMGGLIVGVLGFAVNDSGIVIPAVMLSFFVPAALLLHLALEDAEAVP
jgi:hypothetical protein